ncbi:unnamed protein product [Lymnaea stagnalis]|uniref:NAD(P)-binding domain-containing protein n=1 Tax=Lymnaea stagnalis TaxID=6523 RepID=A0AAV2HWM5_LYMST
MKVFILGATGPTGQWVVKEALTRCHEVVAFVRNPEKLSIKDNKFKGVKGDVTDPSHLSREMKGCDAVVSALGNPSGTFIPSSIYATSGEAIVRSMKEVGLKRLVVCSAWGTQDDKHLPFVWRWIWTPTFLRHIMPDMRKLEDILEREKNNITFTSVRPGILTDDPSTGLPLLTEERQVVIDRPTDKISRHDVAKFMLDCLDTKKYDNKMIAICSSKDPSVK